jgi:hypothetical protein
VIRQYSLRSAPALREFIASLEAAIVRRPSPALDNSWLAVHLYSEFEYDVVGIDGPASALREEPPAWHTCTVDPIPVLQWPEPAIRWLPVDGSATVIEELPGEAAQPVARVAVGAIGQTLLQVDQIFRSTYIFERHWGVVYANIPGLASNQIAIDASHLASASLLVYAWGFLLDEESTVLVGNPAGPAAPGADPRGQWREGPVTMRVYPVGKGA